MTIARVFGCERWGANDGSVPRGFDDLLRYEATRAAEYYDRSAPLEMLISPDSRATLRIMTGIYRGILDRIAAEPRGVLCGRVGLSSFAKLRLVARHAWRGQVGVLEGTP